MVQWSVFVVGKSQRLVWALEPHLCGPVSKKYHALAWACRHLDVSEGIYLQLLCLVEIAISSDVFVC